MPSLSHAELHTRQGEMESRMAAVLHHMQQRRGCWIDREPHQALIAAVVAVAAERPTPLEKKEVQLITQQSERVDGVAAVPQENNTNDDSWPIWLDWLILHNFERTFAVVDSVHGVGCGDGSNGSDSGNGGDSVDCCDIGG